jgi:hypothetical protein
MIKVLQGKSVELSKTWVIPTDYHLRRAMEYLNSAIPIMTLQGMYNPQEIAKSLMRAYYDSEIELEIEDTILLFTDNDKKTLWYAGYIRFRRELSALLRQAKSLEFLEEQYPMTKED